MEKQSNYVTKKEAAEMLGITRMTLNSWIKNPEIKLNAVKAAMREKISVKEINELKKYL